MHAPFLRNRLRRSSTESSDKRSTGPNMNGRLSRIEKWEVLAERAHFQPAELAALCGISLRHLERFFGQHFEKTPTFWLREIRCGIAKELISRGYSNKAIVAELEFASQSHFCREFKKVFGRSPQTFAPSPRT